MRTPDNGDRERVMVLMLTSAGVTNASIRDELRRLIARPFETASIAVVITAALGDARDHSWLMTDLQRLHRLGWHTFNLIDLNGLPASTVAQRLEGSHVIYFAGGNIHQLARSLASTGLAQSVRNLLGGAVVVGASAGSLVFCADLTQRLMSLYGGKDDRFGASGSERVSPLDVVPWFLQPHTDFDTWDGAAAEALGFPMFAIDDQTAITITGNDVVVVSEGRWRFMPGRV